MTSTLLKYNVVIHIVLFIGMTLIHNSCQKFDDERLKENEWNLYYTPGSPPCRSVLMTAKALDFKMNLIPMDLFSDERFKPEFVAINPQHTLPTLVKDDFVLWESRAIMVYLVETFGKEDDPLFPKDTQKRAVINQRLQFDMVTLHQAFVNQYYMWILGFSKKTEKKEELFQTAIGFLETFLKSSDYVAGDSITLADISLVTSVSTFEVSGVDLTKHKNVSNWLQRCKDKMVGYEEINQVGVDRFKTFVDEKMKKTGLQTDLVTKDEVFTATEVLRKAVKAEIISADFYDTLKKIDKSVSFY